MSLIDCFGIILTFEFKFLRHLAFGQEDWYLTHNAMLLGNWRDVIQTEPLHPHRLHD